MTHSPWPKPVWRPTHQVSTDSPLYSCSLKFITSRDSSASRCSHTGWPLSSRITHPSWLGWASSGPFFGATKTRPGATFSGLVVTVITGGRRSGRERNLHVCPTGDEAAVALALGSGSQPSVPPSAASAAPPAVACKNLRRVILGFKTPPLSRYLPGLRTSPLELRKLHHFVSHFAPGRNVSARRTLQRRGASLSHHEVDEPARHVDALAELLAF